MREKLEALLQEFVGLECWRLSASMATGSHLNLDFGNVATRLIGLDKERPYACGEHGLQIESASWRIARGTEVLASSMDSMTDDSAAQLGFLKVQGRRVESVELSDCFDLTLRLEQGLRLDVFCNDTEEGSANYSCSYRAKYYIVESISRRLTTRLFSSDEWP